MGLDLWVEGESLSAGRVRELPTLIEQLSEYLGPEAPARHHALRKLLAAEAVFDGDFLARELERLRSDLASVERPYWAFETQDGLPSHVAYEGIREFPAMLDGQVQVIREWRPFQKCDRQHEHLWGRRPVLVACERRLRFLMATLDEIAAGKPWRETGVVSGRVFEWHGGRLWVDGSVENVPRPFRKRFGLERRAWFKPAKLSDAWKSELDEAFRVCREASVAGRKVESSL